MPADHTTQPRAEPTHVRVRAEGLWYKVTQPSLGRRTAPDPTALPNPALTQHGAAHVKTPLTAEPSCKDEARVGQQGTLSYVWAKRGPRPPAVRDDRHDSAWLFGAVCPGRAVGAAIVMPWVGSEVMSLHLAEIGKQVATPGHAVLARDGAGWHQPGTRLKVPGTITLLRLPPYAPKLNPIENVWAYLRGNMLSMHVRDTHEEKHRGLLQRLQQPHGRRQTHRIHNDPHLGTGQDLRQLV